MPKFNNPSGFHTCCSLIAACEVRETNHCDTGVWICWLFTWEPWEPLDLTEETLIPFEQSSVDTRVEFEEELSVFSGTSLLKVKNMPSLTITLGSLTQSGEHFLLNWEVLGSGTVGGPVTIIMWGARTGWKQALS